MKRWDADAGKFIESPQDIEAFLDDIEAVCRKHGFSIGHEDGHGGFEIEPLSDSNIEWLRNASLSLEPFE